jgi:hypothetical protein
MNEECKHDWKEVYNGIKCTKCELFYPDNGNYFAPDDDAIVYPDYCTCLHPGQLIDGICQKCKLPFFPPKRGKQ